jgi:hypothetical protein
VFATRPCRGLSLSPLGTNEQGKKQGGPSFARARAGYEN